MSDHERPERLSNTSIGSTDNSDDDEDGPTIEIVVKSLTETEFEMTVFPTDTIIDIKSMIFRKEGIPMFQQHLLYYFKELDDESSLQDQGIKEGARLRLVLGMCGGPLSIRRPQPPLNAEPSSDIERLPDTNRDDADSGGSGSRLTVFVFRNGDSVNMLRVQENHDGTYSPLRPNEHTFASISLSQLTEHESGGASCSSSRAAGGSGAKEDGGGAEEDESGAEEDESGAEKNGSSAQEGGSGAGSARDERALRENLLTMDKMRELRRRMEMLRTQRAHARHHSHAGERHHIVPVEEEITL